ncbi:hypothetical protein GR160_10715 [Flavobacterium sp. Sd200]|uniref:DNA sulfur modification protein DndB n=1 Tax=Flavobacterium sp. Sd200 TaxID=2692211 RepID=UPI001368A005|nr:DNA sulfur modification protein DndB [Flavobacterium sp. Sd200]MXN91698.1 hypothetical protein [Flavobacterium sp. Sd200]
MGESDMSTTFAKPFKPEKFPMSIAGDFGTFYTDRKSPVFYINTSFNINDIGNLKPVREILDVSQVDFEELVQRDLDDFRIRRDIANYLTDGMGYKFFPPIVVAMTQPDDTRRAIKRFYPSIKTRLINGENPQFELEFEDSFCVRWFLDDSDSLLSLPTEIRWKSEQTHLMAVDGQHRLVALQAIRGLIGNDRLKSFYKDISRDKDKLNNLTVPVTILFFPNSIDKVSPESIEHLEKFFPKIQWDIEQKADVKQVLRNIFVDVNKTAKQPSKSRTILLDEKDLTSVFTRKVFSSIKNDLPDIYTAVLEYNSLNGKETQIEKNRSLFTTIGIVNNICEYLFKDQPNDFGSNFRIRLGLDQELNVPTSEEFPVEQLKPTEFSLLQRSKCEELFELKWLPSFKILYTSLLPYSRMIELVSEVYAHYKKRQEKDDYNINEDEAYKVLFGGSEERFVLENNAKVLTNSSSKLSLKLLKDIEKGIKDKVEHHTIFYTLMFQKAIFEAISDLISNNFFENDHYATEEELQNMIAQMNIFIKDTPSGSFFDNKSAVYGLIVGSKASPEASKFVSALIVLILLKYKSKTNPLLGGIDVKDEQIDTITSSKLEILEKRIQELLEKEFEGIASTKLKRQEIKVTAETNKIKAKTDTSALNLDRDKYVEKNIKVHILSLKKSLSLK